MHTYVLSSLFPSLKLWLKGQDLTILYMRMEYLHIYTGDTPPSGSLARRADHSLPQPLHLKAVFTDHNERKASIRFEFVSNNADGKMLNAIGIGKQPTQSYHS